MDKLRTLFSDYRAEWSSDLFDNFFVTPPYFAELEAPNSCKLMGGRGTGKTTALQSLRFDVAMPRLGQPPTKMPYLGIYLRINKNRVPVFDGPELSQKDWDLLFCHYINLLICLELCQLTKWLRVNEALSPEFQISTIALSLGGSEAEICDEVALERYIVRSLIAAENYVNNPKDANPVFRSMAESPVRYFAEAISNGSLVDAPLIFCCIDEYENLTDRQQALMNTYIKHAEPPLSYKFGVRQHGLRTHKTRNQNDLLNTPDDYREVDVKNTRFEEFAESVATRRLTVAHDGGLNVPTRLSDFIQSLSLVEEAELLGASKHANSV